MCLPEETKRNELKAGRRKRKEGKKERIKERLKGGENIRREEGQLHSVHD